MLFFQIFRLTCKTLCLATGLAPKSGKLGTPPGAVMRGICLLIYFWLYSNNHVMLQPKKHITSSSHLKLCFLLSWHGNNYSASLPVW